MLVRHGTFLALVLAISFLACHYIAASPNEELGSNVLDADENHPQDGINTTREEGLASTSRAPSFLPKSNLRQVIPLSRERYDRDFGPLTKVRAEVGTLSVEAKMDLIETLKDSLIEYTMTWR